MPKSSFPPFRIFRVKVREISARRTRPPSATHFGTDASQFLGIQPTGKRVEHESAEVYRIAMETVRSGSAPRCHPRPMVRSMEPSTAARTGRGSRLGGIARALTMALLLAASAILNRKALRNGVYLDSFVGSVHKRVCG